jgi:phosphatidylserine/phosphatidylglycerophosphate/cardiolipin synthase-like enzyme
VSTTRFVYNEVLWTELTTRIARSKRVHAAIAYLGKGGSRLVPLKKGNRLVVDMSLGAVRQGVTCPHEVRKFISRGVRVFSRGSLHAKFLIVDNTLIAGSANASRNSKEILDEAGIVTTDPAAVRRASEFFEQLCTEPVGNEYLKKCIAEYQSPSFKPAIEKASPRAKSSHRVVQAKLWFIGGLVALNLSLDEERSVKRVEQRVRKKLKHPKTN